MKAGGFAAFIDAEHALDPEYASNLGISLSDLLVTQPDSGEMALDVVDQLVRSNAVDIIVVDSVAALVPRAELEGKFVIYIIEKHSSCTYIYHLGDMGDSQIGLQARLMSKALRKLTGSLAKSQVYRY
jgi:recombination protein RecA